MQQRSLAKQFEQMELRSKKGFVVNTLTTANQRASSSKSGGSAGVSNFVQKLVGQQQLSKCGTPMAAEVQNMIKINNLTSECEIIGSRSGSLGVTQTNPTAKPQQASTNKAVSST